MVARTLPGGTFSTAEDLAIPRMGYGAMQLAGPGVFGPQGPRRGRGRAARGGGARHHPSSAPRTSCSSPAPHPSRTCARTSPAPR
jgi:hypothetical protein